MKVLKESVLKVDSDGNELSVEQVEFFKDSKVRDDKGNLLVCYHGTEYAGFQVFDARESENGNYKYKNKVVNFFVRERSTAKGYSGTDNDVDFNNKEPHAGNYSVYLNIKNPYIYDGNHSNWKGLKSDKITKIRKDGYDSFVNKWSKNTFYDIDEVFDELQDDLNDIGLDIEIDDSGDCYNIVAIHEGGHTMSTYIEKWINSIDEILESERFQEEFNFSETPGGLNTTNDIVKYVLRLNKEKHTDYDGVIITNVMDSGKYGWVFDESNLYITLKSSNQIKNISNKTPTNSLNINENKRKHE